VLLIVFHFLYVCVLLLFTSIKRGRTLTLVVLYTKYLSMYYTIMYMYIVFNTALLFVDMTCKEKKGIFLLTQ